MSQYIVMLLIVLIFPAYLISRAVLPLRLKAGWKIAIAAFLVVCACKFHILSLFGGPDLLAPRVPTSVQLLGAWLFALVFLLFLLMLATDLVRGLLYLACFAVWGRKAPRAYLQRICRIDPYVNIGLAAVVLLVVSVGLYGGARMPGLRQESLTLANLPPQWDGFTVAVLADLHIDNMTRPGHLARIVEITNAAKPDITVIVGDFVDGNLAERGTELESLAQLAARYGVFGIPGNHEYYSGYLEWMAFFREQGIDMLENNNRLLPRADDADGDGNRDGVTRIGAIAVAGVTDPNATAFGLEPPDIDRALQGIPCDAATLLLAHRPAFAREAAAAGVDLQISGHTHGGSIRGFDWLVARFNDGFVAGHYRVGGLQLYVSRGTGMWGGFPIRFGVPAEITLLTLRSPG